jgi:hypothetical protein
MSVGYRAARAWVVAALAIACAGGGGQPKPVAALSSSVRASTAFESIRQAWGDPEHTTPAALRGMLERFLVAFPDDGLVPLARIALALVAMNQSDLATADAQLALTGDVPTGTTRDLWTIACARRLRLREEPEAALRLLRPLLGKNVDPLPLTLSALATHRDYEAISYMDAWLRASAEEEKDLTVRAVTSIVGRLPKDVLVGALQAMRAQRESFGYGVEIQRILAARLVDIATSSGDAKLARMLLDSDAGAVVAAGDAAIELGELATSRRGLNVVEGRTIGLLLPTDSPGLRDEAADVLRGVLWALGLPRGVRSLGAVPREASADAGAPRAGCATLAAAPEVAEPRPELDVRLVTRDDSGGPDRIDPSLDELAGAGAAIVVAALDGPTALRALRWSEAHGMPLIALVPPEGAESAPDAPSFGFVLGEGRGDVLAALVRAAPSLATESVAPVIDTSEASRYPPQGGRVGPLTLGPPVSCEVPAVRAGEPRFPIVEWTHDKRSAWLVSGSANCASDLAQELSGARVRGIVALTLEAAALPSHSLGLRVLSASAGIVPVSEVGDARDDELRRFSTTLGRVSWWTALGRDAATLARLAVEQIPADDVSDAKSVAARRATARDHLAAAQARLWTTEASGWKGAVRVMQRTVCTVEAAGK